MSRNISRLDGNIGGVHFHNVMSEDQFADVWRSRSIASDVNNEAEVIRSC